MVSPPELGNVPASVSKPLEATLYTVTLLLNAYTNLSFYLCNGQRFTHTAKTIIEGFADQRGVFLFSASR